MATLPPNAYTPKVDIDAHRKRAMGDEIDGIFDNLNTIQASDIKKLPESVFVNNFLPLFCGEKVPANVDLATWAAIAGNPYMPVDVINDKNEVLYTVPALFDREAMTPGSADRGAAPMAHVMKTTEQLRNVSPVRAQAYLQQQLNLRNMHGGMGERMKANIAAWNVIFARYQRPLITTGADGLPAVMSAAETQAAVATEQTKDLKYEEDDLL